MSLSEFPWDKKELSNERTAARDNEMPSRVRRSLPAQAPGGRDGGADHTSPGSRNDPKRNIANGPIMSLITRPRTRCEQRRSLHVSGRASQHPGLQSRQAHRPRLCCTSATTTMRLAPTTRRQPAGGPGTPGRRTLTAGFQNRHEPRCHVQFRLPLARPLATFLPRTTQFVFTSPADPSGIQSTSTSSCHRRCALRPACYRSVGKWNNSPQSQAVQPRYRVRHCSPQSATAFRNRSRAIGARGRHQWVAVVCLGSLCRPNQHGRVSSPSNASARLSKTAQRGNLICRRRRKSKAPKDRNEQLPSFVSAACPCDRITGSLRPPPSQQQPADTENQVSRLQELCNRGPRKSPPLRVGTDNACPRRRKSAARRRRRLEDDSELPPHVLGPHGESC